MEWFIGLSFWLSITSDPLGRINYRNLGLLTTNPYQIRCLNRKCTFSKEDVAIHPSLANGDIYIFLKSTECLDLYILSLGIQHGYIRKFYLYLGLFSRHNIFRCNIYFGLIDLLRDVYIPLREGDTPIILGKENYICMSTFFLLE